MKIIDIYTLTTCPYCIKAKEILNKNNLEYKEYVIDNADDSVWENLEKRSGMDTVPQIYVGETLIGGCSELEKLLKKDNLKSLKELVQNKS